MKRSLFVVTVMLALSWTMAAPAVGVTPFSASDDVGNTTPDRSEPGNSAIPRSHMDAGMQHIQEGHPDPRASMAPPNRDRNMATNPHVAPSLGGRDAEGERTTQRNRGVQ